MDSKELNRRLLIALLKIVEDNVANPAERLGAAELMASLPDFEDEPAPIVCRTVVPYDVMARACQAVPQEPITERALQQGPGYLPVWFNGVQWQDNRNCPDSKALFPSAKTAIESGGGHYERLGVIHTAIAYVPPGKTVADVLAWLNSK